EAGSKLRSFPYATLIPHSACFALFGPYGFPIADVLVTGLYYLLLLLFFRTLGVSRGTSTFAALLLTLQLPIRLELSALLGNSSPSFPLIAPTWGMRIPRPFVSSLYVLLVLITALRVLASNPP